MASDVPFRYMTEMMIAFSLPRSLKGQAETNARKLLRFVSFSQINTYWKITTAKDRNVIKFSLRCYKVTNRRVTFVLRPFFQTGKCHKHLQKLTKIAPNQSSDANGDK